MFIHLIAAGENVMSIIATARSQASPAQYELFDSAEEAHLYHDPSAYGFFSILYRPPGQEAKAQRSYKLPLLAQVISLLPRDRDTWLSQAEFTRPNRRIVNLARLSLLFADIDCYKLGITPEKALAAILTACDAVGFPHPSIAIHSGRGLQIKWLLAETLPRWMLPRWNAIQSHLVDMFLHIGADHGAKDASRVLRLVGAVNTRSGQYAQVIRITPDASGWPMRYDFDSLADILLPNSRQQFDKKLQNHPLTHDEMNAIAMARIERENGNHPFSQDEQDAIAMARIEREARKSQLKLIPGGADRIGLRRFSDRQLAWHRMEDIRKLIQIRGGVLAGQSMATLFWSLNFLLLSGATNSVQMYHEAKALAREFDFGELTRQDELSSLYAKAKAAEAGQTVTFKGREYPPLYTPKNASLIELFCITDDEQRQLRTIISTDQAKKRHADRQRAARQQAGAVSRDAYLASHEDKRVQARLMRAHGLSTRAIATALDVSVGAVHKWCK